MQSSIEQCISVGYQLPYRLITKFDICAKIICEFCEKVENSFFRGKIWRTKKAKNLIVKIVKFIA